jgi:hypothetical protein
MARTFFTWEENEAYKEGRRDEERHRRNYEYDEYSDRDRDQAYFQGRRDEQREERVREEEREYERQREEAEIRRREEQRRQEEVEYNMMLEAQMEEQMEAERQYYEDQMVNDYDALNEIPITEEELFHDIREDEINELTDNI